MRLVFTPQAWEDYVYWQHNDRALVTRTHRLLDDMMRHPTTGIGQPEPLKYGIVGAWSRRITEEHRVVYQLLGEDLVVLQARYHYGKP